MNIFTDLLFLFVYIFTLLYFQMPNVANNNYLTHKFYLFISIFGFYYIIQLIKRIRNGCSVDPYIILQQSLNMALFCVLGYSLYVDLLYMDWSQGYFGDIEVVNHTKRFVAIAFIIIVFVGIIQLFGLMFRAKEIC